MLFNRMSYFSYLYLFNIVFFYINIYNIGIG